MAARRFVLYLLLFYQISGIAIFLKGFLPLKKNTPGFSTRNINGSLVRGKFDRLIVVMIDALRADFVFGKNSYMSYTKSLIAYGDTYR
jgi:ethanolaminephosphotransferase